MVKYYYKIDNSSESRSFTQLIQVGMRTLEFHFQWAIVSEEQFRLIVNYLNRRANTDPILRRNGNYDRDYNWYTYYIDLVGTNLEEWLGGNPEIPESLIGKTRAKQLSLLRMYIGEAISLQPAVRLYTDLLRWGFRMTCDDLDTVVGFVQPGGWYHNQDSKLSFRFTSAMEDINEESISQVVIEFEVYDE